MREPGRVSSAEAVALTMPLHYVEWPEDENPTFTCTAEVGAKCRLVCAEDCDAESWPCGHDEATDEPHAMKDSGECHVLLFLAEDDHYEHDRYSGPIKVTWEADYYDWEPVDV